MPASKATAKKAGHAAVGGFRPANRKAPPPPKKKVEEIRREAEAEAFEDVVFHKKQAKDHRRKARQSRQLGWMLRWSDPGFRQAVKHIAMAAGAGIITGVACVSLVRAANKN